MAPTTDLPPILRPTYEPLADELLRTYFGLGKHRGHEYDGAYFETLGGPWFDPRTIDEITAADIVAVSCLSVDVPVRASMRILGADGPTLARRLRAVPADLDLWAAPDDLIGPASAAAELWDLLRSYPGMGPTTTSKLIARKRPRLAPVFDDVVRTELGLADSVGHWSFMRDTMRASLDGGRPLHERLAAAADRVGLGPAVTPLRVFDVLVWLAGNPRERERNAVRDAAEKVGLEVPPRASAR